MVSSLEACPTPAPKPHRAWTAQRTPAGVGQPLTEVACRRCQLLGRPLGCRRRLTRKVLQTQVDACPSWRLCGPNSCRGLRDLRIVQCPSSDEDEMRAGFGFAEELGTANTTEPPMHLIAAIGNALKIGEIALHSHRLLWKTGIDCPQEKVDRRCLQRR